MTDDLTEFFTETAAALNQIRQQQLPLLLQPTDWQSRYRCLMQLGKQVPAFVQSQQHEHALISGCDSKAWLLHQQDLTTGRHFWAFDSEARLIKGTVTVLLCQINGKTSDELSALQLRPLLSIPGLQQNLSPSRQNGLLAVLEKLAVLAGIEPGC
jgi:cysteine desulfuration protein SufE